MIITPPPIEKRMRRIDGISRRKRRFYILKTENALPTADTGIISNIIYPYDKATI